MSVTSENPAARKETAAEAFDRKDRLIQVVLTRVIEIGALITFACLVIAYFMQPAGTMFLNIAGTAAGAMVMATLLRWSGRLDFERLPNVAFDDGLPEIDKREQKRRH